MVRPTKVHREGVQKNKGGIEIDTVHCNNNGAKGAPVTVTGSSSNKQKKRKLSQEEKSYPCEVVDEASKGVGGVDALPSGLEFLTQLIDCGATFDSESSRNAFLQNIRNKEDLFAELCLRIIPKGEVRSIFHDLELWQMAKVVKERLEKAYNTGKISPAAASSTNKTTSAPEVPSKKASREDRKSAKASRKKKKKKDKKKKKKEKATKVSSSGSSHHLVSTSGGDEDLLAAEAISALYNDIRGDKKGKDGEDDNINFNDGDYHRLAFNVSTSGGVEDLPGTEATRAATASTTKEMTEGKSNGESEKSSYLPQSLGVCFNAEAANESCSSPETGKEVKKSRAASSSRKKRQASSTDKSPSDALEFPKKKKPKTSKAGKSSPSEGDVKKSANTKQQVESEQRVHGPTSKARTDRETEKKVAKNAKASKKKVAAEATTASAALTKESTEATTSKKRKRSLCTFESCSSQARSGGFCSIHGANKTFCKVDDCSNLAISNGVCIRHGAKTATKKKGPRKKCSADDCTSFARVGGVCIKHGATQQRKQCTFEGCTKQVQKGGFCFAHGAEAKKCNAEGCESVAQQGGLCFQHGARVQTCSVDGCTNQVQNGGVCVRHWANVSKCSAEGCENKAKKGGVCKKRNTSKKKEKATTAGCTKQSRKEGKCRGHTAKSGDEQKICFDVGDHLCQPIVDLSPKQAIYHEFQDKKLCAIHALNVLLQRPKVTQQFMNGIAAAVRLEFPDIPQKEVYSKQNGSYDISVVIKAADALGIELTYMRENDIDKVLTGEERTPAYLVHTKGQDPHYHAILRIDDSYWDLDSLNGWPVKIDRTEMVRKYIVDDGKEYTCLKVGFKPSHSLDESNNRIQSPNVSESKPCAIDESNRGHWWSFAFLNKLTEEHVTLHTSLSGCTCSHELPMQSTDTVRECFDSFCKLRCECTRTRGIKRRTEKLNIKLGDAEVVTYTKCQWENLPVKLISEHSVTFST